MQLKQFDKVRIITTKRIGWVNYEPGTVPSPHGAWSVICIVGKTKALICKGTMSCLAPINDLELLGDNNAKR